MLPSIFYHFSWLTTIYCKYDAIIPCSIPYRLPIARCVVASMASPNNRKTWYAGAVFTKKKVAQQLDYAASTTDFLFTCIYNIFAFIHQLGRSTHHQILFAKNQWIAQEHRGSNILSTAAAHTFVTTIATICRPLSTSTKWHLLN